MCNSFVVSARMISASVEPIPVSAYFSAGNKKRIDLLSQCVVL